MRYWKKKEIPSNINLAISIACYLTEDPRRKSSLASLLWCLCAQTFPRWQAVIVHDGPWPENWSPKDLGITDPRFIFVSRPRKQQHGHPHRREALLAHTQSTTHVAFMNDDGWYAPVYFEAMLHTAVVHDAGLVFCDMVHSHKLWQPIQGAPKHGKIDVGSFIAKRNLVEKTPWNDYGFSGDWSYFEALLKTGAKAIRVPHVLFVHN